MELPEHVRINRDSWNAEAADYVEPARRNWAQEEITWGIYDVPEAELGALPDVAGADVVELGCGTAYFSAWLARRGARPTGVDISENQLATARAMQAEHGLAFPLIQASAEAVPLPDACADLVLSEYGASLWCEPEAWIAEAARLLRPGGRLVFLTNTLLVALTSPDDRPVGDRLLRDLEVCARSATRTTRRRVPSPPRRVDRRARPERAERLTALHELYAPAGAAPTRFDWITVEWARRWPVEELWTAAQGVGVSARAARRPRRPPRGPCARRWTARGRRRARRPR